MTDRAAIQRTKTERDIGALLLRLTVGGLMLPHGIDKVTGGIGWMPGALEAKGVPGFVAYGVYLGEVVAPLLMLFGLAMRTSAAAIAFTMLMAVYVAHADEVFSLGEHGEYALELQMLFAVGAVCAALVGPGRFSVPSPAWLKRF